MLLERHVLLLGLVILLLMLLLLIFVPLLLLHLPVLLEESQLLLGAPAPRLLLQPSALASFHLHGLLMLLH